MRFIRIFPAVAFILFSVIDGSAQNFSGLQNKKLNKVEDAGFALESLIGRLGGSVDGNIDSVVVTQEYEKELRLRIYYSGFQNAYFKVSTMSQSRSEESWVTAVKFNQTEKNNPAEITLALNNSLPEDAQAESPYLRIDIAKKANGGGKVRVFQLQKMWKANASGIIRVSLQPIGAAATLTETPEDKMPAKRIRFDNKKLYEIRDIKKTTMAPIRSGGQAFETKYIIPDEFRVIDINGNWTNTNSSAKLNSMIISNGNYIKLYNQDNIGSHSLTASGNITQKAANRYSGQLTPFDPNSKLVLSIVLVFNGDNVEMKYYVNSTVSGVVGSVYNYTFYRKPRVVTIVDPLPVHTIDPTVPAPTTVAGPDKNAPINLWDDIAVDNSVEFDRPQDISNINITIYRDIHPASGMFYMYPADYHLRWDADGKTKKGYAFSIAYGKQGDGSTTASADAPVRFSATLTAGINNREINFVSSLLKSRYPEFKDLVYLPLRETVQSSFQNALSLFGVTADKISVVSNTDLNNDVTVAWSTNPDTKEFIQTSLTSGDGIVASMVLKPKETGISDITIPAIISLSASRTLGRMSLDPQTWRDHEWTNATVYPLKLKYLHVLKKSIVGNTPIIYSWGINDIDVPSGSRVSFDNGRVPKWLDNDPSAIMWLSYTVDACDSCNSDVINAVTDGVSNSTVQQLRFVIPDPVFDSLKATSFVITVRSKQADPKADVVVELPAMTISKDPTKNYMIGPLFIPKSIAPDYEYKVVMISTDGDVFSTDKWVHSTSKEVYLGKTPMQDMFRGIVPWIK